MSGITYAHTSCFYCQGWAREAETEANRRPDAEAAQVGDDHHWARYHNDPIQAPAEGETEMTETKEWLTPHEFAEATGGKAASGTRMLVDGRPAVYCLHPTYGMLAARWTDEEGGYAVNLGIHEVLFHKSGIDALRQLQHEQEEDE